MLLLAHPDRDSFNGRMADAYEHAARSAGPEAVWDAAKKQNQDETFCFLVSLIVMVVCKIPHYILFEPPAFQVPL